MRKTEIMTRHLNSSDPLFSKKALALAVSAALVPQAQAQEAEDSAMLEEVIVTATKRAANVQDIPIAVTAVTGLELVDLQINNVLQLEKVVPGMKLLNRGNDPMIIIRGAGTAGTNDVAVPIYVDGLYRPRFGQALASYIDLERVEVLRGPQGTLFGRNTLGGLVNLISNKPNPEAFDAGGAITLGDYSLLKFEGMVNIPLGEDWALRIAASDTKRDPYVEDIYNKKGGLKDADNTYARGQLMWEPSETFDIMLTATYWKDTANGNADYAYNVLGIPVNPETQKTNGIDGVMDPRQGTRDGWSGGRSQAGQWPEDWTAYTTDPRKIANDYAPWRDIKETSVSLTMNWDVGFADLRAVIGSFDYEETRMSDSDISANPTEWARQNPDADPGNANGPGYWQQCWSGPSCGIIAGQRVVSNATQADINLNSNGDGNLQWTVGFFYYDDSGDGDTTHEFVWAYTDAANPQQPSWAHWLYQTHGGTKSTALYGQAEYSFTDRFRATAGLRYSNDKRNTYTQHVDWGPAVHGWGPGYYSDHLENPGSRFDDWPSYVETDRSEVVKGDKSHTDWKLALQYDITDDVMLYGSGSTGYIAGAPKGGGSTQLTEPNEVESFELGLKSFILNGSMRLNAALYHNDFDGLSTTTFVQQGGTILAQSAPGGSMTSKGLELEMDWQATEALNIKAGMAFDNSKLDKFSEQESRFEEGGDVVDDNGNRFYDLDGKTAKFSPDWTLNIGATYDIDMGKAGMLVPGVLFYHSDDYKTQNVEYFFAHQKAYSTWDLRLTWYAADRPISVQAYVLNATDELYKTETTVYSGNRAMADWSVPRTYGLRAAWNF